jgi:chromosomal replication initiation ATPase DnaA
MAGIALARQLALDLPFDESFAREDFLEAQSNAAALNLIERWPDWSANELLLVGPAGAGKSHLAAIWARVAGGRTVSAHALADTHLPTALATGALVVEDLAPDAFDERALFHLLNLAREQDAFLLFTAQTVPASWPLTIRDTASRLRAIPVATIDAADDALMRAILLKLFADRQLLVDDPLLQFLLARIERSPAAARAAVALLDAEALKRGRPVNRALAADLLRDAALSKE